MIDLNYLRENAEKVKAIIASGRSDPAKADVDKWMKLDEKRRELLQEQEELNKQRNELAQIGKQGGNIEEIRSKGQELKQKTQELETKLNKIKDDWQKILDWIPNIPVEMPEGKGEPDNIVIKAWIPGEGYLPEDNLGKVGDTHEKMPQHVIYADKKDLKPKHHLDIGEELGIIDNKQAGSVSGTRFTYIIGDLARMQYAIQQLVFAELLKRGFKQIIPPLLVKDRSLYGTSHFPEQVDQVYKIDSENIEENQELYLVGSSEPANFSYFMDKVLEADELPQKLFAYTVCFRSEAGSWGKDTKGIKRLHQFDKIEMNVVCRPDQTPEIFDELLGVNEWLLQQMELPYHLVLKSTGDAGYHASAKQIDPEVWLSGQKEFMELMTITNTTDFQARRMNIKYRTADGKLEYVHTINDTAVAMGRMLIAIIDNYQQSDGTILVPKVLQGFMGKQYIGK